MKRNLKKAFAFIMAVAMVVTTLVMPTEAKAAEYEESVEVMKPEYNTFGYIGDSAYFANYVEVVNGESSTRQVGELILVDKKGNKTPVDVKNTDGSYKYLYVSEMFNEHVALIESNDGQYSYSLYREDGTWIGGGEEKYQDILIVGDGNYIVSNDTTCNLIDAKGNVLIENIFEPVELEGINEMYWWPCAQFGEYRVIERTYYTEEGPVPESKIFDADYKEVEGVELYKEANIIYDTLVTFEGTSIKLYNEELQSKDIVCELEAPAEGYKQTADISWISSEYNYKTERKMYGVRIWVVTENLETGEESSNYVFKYYDVETLEEVPESEISYWPESSQGSSIVSTDVIYIISEDGVVFKQGEKELFDFEAIIEYVKAQKSVEQIGISTWGIYGIGGDIIIECVGYAENQPETEYALVIKKSDEYALDKAVILDKSIYNVYAYPSIGMIEFTDGTYYFEGEVHDDNKTYRFLAMYDFEVNRYNAYAYVVYDEVEGNNTRILYDIEGTVIAKAEYQIIDYANDCFVITMNKTEDATFYGCVLAKEIISANEDILEQLPSVEAGGKVEVTIEKNEEIAAEVLGAIQGEDINLVVTAPSGITWTINGKDITATDLKNVDLTVDIVKDVVPAEAISAIKVEGEKVELSLAHTGDFGFKAELKINVDTKNADKYANLFYYNPTSKALEFQGAAKIDKDGNAAFTYTHASDYVIIINEEAYTEPAPEPETETETEDEKKPIISEKGDASGMVVTMVLLLGVAIIAVSVIEKKRRTVR